ncbi:bifunctional diaminohydroxyphosphoribosylaminopyrimidine deaminase/5-amino-6-(5-phosphoribosylamino)uracil reductase RibD [Paracoccus sp. IB05]|uniref:bifunctional diaminohydroxyphosphoribosylaminopyrimidine deaminase/5-amino-6-(5-phosphoribosylamino)uracil reductase RibD n=1 Tax=Paracoccus sp. IB05 TaxID=2779367 RepID=UPI0021059817|nr:bifunctional diaminohydroxyphosphoribosylaminopyrimidine deaminase/5-amino-6-(5-phosphoribosylamino)uracil reductase RibD [Paracoccus sp. IB05]
MTRQIDETHMTHALRLAARGNGTCWPNPSVGCVLVKDGRVVGRGTTQPGGRPHAERVALTQAGAAARGATAYVTLEPCAHHGNTSPCAEALVAAGVARVVTAITDPDARVAGRGHAILRAAGIEVTEGILAAEATEITAGFLKRVTRGLPFVTLKLATTLDGRIATGTGESRWITGPESRRAVHAMRMEHDAVMIGSGTARADDPDLTVRDLGAPRQPVRIVIDSRLSHRPGSRLGRTAREVPVWLLHGSDAPSAAQAAWAATGAKLLPCPRTGAHLDLTAALKTLAAEGLTRIFCEGGGSLAAALIRAGLVDELACFTAGALIGEDGRAALGPLGLSALQDAPRLRLISERRTGADLLCRWKF